MAYFKKPTSFYSQTPVTEFYLDIWTPIGIPATANDVLMTLEHKYHKRPDLLAYDLFGTVNLFWVFAVRNPDILIDPIEDFVAGLQLYIPSASAMQGI